LLTWATPGFAQQRPLVTEDPEPIGAGRILLEAGADFSDDVFYPASGLEGSLWRIGVVGLSVGISSIAELQIDGGIVNHLSINEITFAPLSGLLDLDGESTTDIEDIVIATKVRLLSETPKRLALALRFATKLPNATNESGLGLDTTDFAVSLLGARTVQSIRVVGNIGLGILGDPTNGNRQNDVLTYGASLARAITDRAELVGEINGRLSTRTENVPPGTETRGLLRFGGRYTRNAIRFDGNLFFGLTSHDPTWGFGGGLTYVFQGFNVP
jgi:hypothetical protein